MNSRFDCTRFSLVIPRIEKARTYVTHIHFPQLFLGIASRTPCQGFRHASITQARADPSHLLKRLNVNELLDPAVAGQHTGALAVALAQQVVDEHALQAGAAPGLVLDVVEALHGVDLGEVLYAGGLVAV